MKLHENHQPNQNYGQRGPDPDPYLEDLILTIEVMLKIISDIDKTSKMLLQPFPLFQQINQSVDDSMH